MADINYRASSCVEPNGSVPIFVLAWCESSFNSNKIEQTLSKFKLEQALSTISFLTFILLEMNRWSQEEPEMTEKAHKGIEVDRSWSSGHQGQQLYTTQYNELVNQKQPPKTWIQSFIFGGAMHEIIRQIHFSFYCLD